MKRSLIALVSSLAIAMAAPALAAGGGGGGGGGGGPGGGEASVQDPEFQAAMGAVRQQDWQQVVAKMGAYTQRDPNNADAWNELGHAHRKLGQIDPALNAYGKALKIDPKHKGAHEYLGEAYMQMGEVARAEQELKALDKICFFPCEEYSDLKAQISAFKTKQAKAGS